MSNRERFIEHLSASRGAVWLVAAWLGSRGHEVVVPPTSVVPKGEDPRLYADQGDLYVVKYAGRIPSYHRVEVKHSGQQFSGLDDWPFPRYFICATHAWDQAKPKPSMFLTVSRDMDHVACVRASSREHWTEVGMTDSRYTSYSQQVYAVDPAHVSWHPLQLKPLTT